MKVGERFVHKELTWQIMSAPQLKAHMLRAPDGHWFCLYPSDSEFKIKTWLDNGYYMYAEQSRKWPTVVFGKYNYAVTVSPEPAESGAPGEPGEFGEFGL